MEGNDEPIKARMDQRLNHLQWSLVDLADATNESYRNVHRWIREDVKVPAHFITRFARVIPVNPTWLLTGEGTPDPVKESTAKVALERIAHVLDSVRLTSSTGMLSESVVKSTFDGVVAYDEELRYTLWNPAMERLTGIARLAVLGKKILDVFPHLVGTEVEEHLRATLEGEVRTVDERHFSIPESARSAWYESRYSPLRDGSGEIVGGICICREVSDRKRAERLREEVEARLRALLELCPEASFVGAEGRLVEASEPLANLVRGEGPGALEGTPLDELFGSRDGTPSLPEALEGVEEGERVGPLAGRLQRRDGSAVDVEVIAAGIRFREKPAVQGLVRAVDT